MTDAPAMLGNPPAFESPLVCGQNHFPDPDRYEQAFQGIFDRQYYNNNGPLHESLEARLREFLGVKHALCTSNAMMGLMMAADALRPGGKVLVPAFAPPELLLSLRWAGIDPVFCDVDPVTWQLETGQIEHLPDKTFGAILAVNLWGGRCHSEMLQTWAEAHRKRLYFDSACALGSVHASRPQGGAAGDLEVYSMHADHIVSSADGGIIATDDADLAHRLQNIRPSYTPSTPAPVVRVANARLSEAQAAIGLINLDDFADNRQHNEQLFRLWQTGLSDLAGIQLYEPRDMTISNRQNIILCVTESIYGLSREMLVAALKTENVQARHCFDSRFMDCFSGQTISNFPISQFLYQSCLEMPHGKMVSAADVETMIRLLQTFREHATTIRERYV